MLLRFEKHAEVITKEEEVQLWESGELGMKDPKALKNAVFHYNKIPSCSELSVSILLTLSRLQWSWSDFPNDAHYQLLNIIKLGTVLPVQRGLEVRSGANWRSFQSQGRRYIIYGAYETTNFLIIVATKSSKVKFNNST